MKTKIKDKTMNITLFKRLAVPLLLLLLMALLAPAARANSLEDVFGQTWTVSSVRNGSDTYQIRIRVTQGADPAQTIWATSTGYDNLDPFIFTNGTRVWVVWSEERTVGGVYDICLIETTTTGVVGAPVPITKTVGNDQISYRDPYAVKCPLGFHVAFRRDTVTPERLIKSICYKTNIALDGSPIPNWDDAMLESVPILSDHDGTEPQLLLGNGDDGRPTVLLFKDWVTMHSLGGDSKKIISVAIWERVLLTPSDPNPWEKVQFRLPDNP